MASLEDQHIEMFGKFDFESWNGPDWDLFRDLHTDDVVVEMMGQRTEGLDAHVDMCQQVVRENPDLKIDDHPIKIAQGEWTCVVGRLSSGRRMVTVARWRDNAISEEYIFVSD